MGIERGVVYEKSYIFVIDGRYVRFSMQQWISQG